MRTIIVEIEVDDDMAIAEDLGTIEYIEREFGWLANSGIFLKNAKILDSDDECDSKAIEMANTIFEEDESYTAFIYEDDGIITADLSTYDDKEEAIEFAKSRNWDEVVNDITGEVVWKK